MKAETAYVVFICAWALAVASSPYWTRMIP